MTTPDRLFRVILADDEPIARAGMRAILAHDATLDIVAECATGTQAVEAVLAHRPDILLLDVQMPDLDGFGVLRALPRELWPAIVFVTAYDSYALRAFDLHAVDYLVKPFGDERAREAVERAKQRVLSSGLPAMRKLVDELLATRPADTAATPLRHLAFRDGERVLLIAVGDIDWIEAEGDYVRLHCGQTTHLVRARLKDLLEKLDPARYVRLHRSVVVNVDRIRELTPASHGDFTAILADGTRLKVSRTQRAELARLTGDLF